MECLASIILWSDIITLAHITIMSFTTTITMEHQVPEDLCRLLL
jgi:hypothetical protein